MLATLKYRNQRCVNRKSVEQELTKLPPHLTVSHPPHLHGPVSMGGELPALTSLSMPVWDDSWSARQQEEIVLLHNSDPWTWFFFFPCSPPYAPSPHSYAVGSYPVQSNAWIAHVRLSFEPSFRNTDQTKLTAPEERVQWEEKASPRFLQGKKNQIISGLHLQ